MTRLSFIMYVIGLGLASIYFSEVTAPPPPTDRGSSFYNFLRVCRNIVSDVVRSLDSSVDHAAMQHRLQAVANNLVRAAIDHDECAEILDLVQTMMQELQHLERVSGDEVDGFQTQRSSNGNVGPSSYAITRQQLEYLFDLDFSVPLIASMLHVSVSTIRRRLRFFKLSYRQRRTTMTDHELDNIVRPICRSNRHLGHRSVNARLVSDGVYTTRQRVRASMLRVDPSSLALRWCRTVQRRTYRVSGPNSLWHIDGNHKLIRWGFVFHGGIDGFSRLIVFLTASCDNRAETVFSSFLQATARFGTPSRVRADCGSENNEVENYMNIYRGRNRGSLIRGRSVHNQRIERLWLDLYFGCTNVYYDLFYYLEDIGLLDVNNEMHRWCLHYVFRPRIARSVEIFQRQWNRHRLSSARGRSPLQLYVEGVLRLHGSGRQHISELFFDPGHGEDINQAHIPVYGVDWNGPTPLVNDNDTRLNDIPCPLSDDQLEQLQATVLPLSESVDGRAIDLYLHTLRFVGSADDGQQS